MRKSAPIPPCLMRLLWAAFLLPGWLAQASAADVQFSRDIQPILSENCFACHGPDADKRAADLRLDLRDQAIRSRALVPGKPHDSLLIARIESTDDSDRMPPPKSHKELTNRQKQLLRDWVTEGGKYEEHWAFQPIRRPEVPPVQNGAWPRNAIDHFVLSKLEQEKLAPASEAKPETLLRRIAFNLTGLPPSLDELAAFTAHHDDAATVAVVNRWLASPQYGERWARHWMDLVRYADSAGYELDYLFTHAWQYRDWLVQSFSGNKPLDRFIQEQIAGDQLWPNSEEALAGTYYLTIGPMRFEGGIQRSKDRENEWYTDLADTTGSVFLGLTMGCARCHDHKFDPIPQADYYGLQAVFADSELQAKRIGEGGGSGDTRPAHIQVAQRSEPGVVQVLRRGEVDLPVQVATASLPSVWAGEKIADEKNRRARLARWLTSSENPLAARVLVNRVWQWHFGEGIVRTPSDFGRQGALPTHPQLLDWLASELIESNWDLHHLQRLMINSATYRQSSLSTTEAMTVDSDHRWLSCFPRRRLEAEELRDAMLAASGELNPKHTGPPVVPPVETWALAALRNKNWQPTEDPREHARRSVYFVVRRSIKLPYFDSFNSPDNISSCPKRDTTVVASQALTMFNSEQSLQSARAFAKRLWIQSSGDADQAASLAWRLLFSREISAEERGETITFLQAREQEWLARTDAKIVPLPGIDPAPLPTRWAAWVEWCLALLNTSEFVYVD